MDLFWKLDFKNENPLLQNLECWKSVKEGNSRKNLWTNSEEWKIKIVSKLLQTNWRDSGQDFDREIMLLKSCLWFGKEKMAASVLARRQVWLIFQDNFDNMIWLFVHNISLFIFHGIWFDWSFKMILTTCFDFLCTTFLFFFSTEFCLYVKAVRL